MNVSIRNPWAGLFAVLTAAGGIYMIMTLVMGQKLFGSSDSVPWNILVPTYAFLAAASAGIAFFASLGDVLGVGQYKFLSRIGTAAATAVLISALVAIGMDLGRPLGFFLFVTSPNFASPMWWMAITYLTLLVIRGVKLWTLGKEKTGVLTAIGYLGLVLSVVAPLILGWLFGSLTARPMWAGSMTPIYFLATALAIGAAGVLLLGAISGEGNLQSLGYVLAAMLAVAGSAAVLKLSGTPEPYAGLIKSGAFSTWFWFVQIGLGLAVPLLVAVTPLVRQKLFAILAAVSVFAGALTAFVLEVLAGQALPVMANLPYKAYKITTAEVAIVAGVIGMAGLLFLVLSAYTTKAEAVKKLTA